MNELKLPDLSSKWSRHVVFRVERGKHMAGSLMRASSGLLLLEGSQGEQMAGQVGVRARLVLENDSLQQVRSDLLNMLSGAWTI